MKYLLVVAHPDDETLGAGASIWKWSREGHTVDVCIMCTEAKARAFRPSDEELGDDTNESNKFLGVNKISKQLQTPQHNPSPTDCHEQQRVRLYTPLNEGADKDASHRDT